MPRHHVTVPVPNPINDAFVFVRDFRNATKWDPQVTAAEKVTPGPIQTGSRFVLRSRFLWTTIELPYTVVEQETDRRLVLTGKNWLFTYRDEITFASEGEGSRLTYDATMSLRGLMTIGNPILGLVFKSLGSAAVDGIRRTLVAQHHRKSAAGSTSASNVSPEGIRAITAMADQPTLRNLLITQTYYELSERLGEMLGRENVNWCTYAIWASKTAGRFIREDEVPKAFREILAKKDRLRDRVRELNQALCSVDADAGLYTVDDLNPIGEVVDEIALFVAGGNTIVFEELGALYADFVATFESDTEPDPSKLETFLDKLQPGDSQPDRVELDESRNALLITRQGGQDLLREAMLSTYSALFESDPKRKAELILLGNAQAGLHEQIRLGPYIRGSLETPVDEILFSRNNDALAQRLARSVLGRAQEILHCYFQPLGEQVAETFREFSTGTLMQMNTPAGTLQLGEDLPAPSGALLFPPILDPIKDPNLLEILTRFGAGGDLLGRPPGLWARLRAGRLSNAFGVRPATDAGSAAKDWSDLFQRMRYIFAYFRSRQRETRLQQAPFDKEQTAALRRGSIPHGEL